MLPLLLQRPDESLGRQANYGCSCPQSTRPSCFTLQGKRACLRVPRLDMDGKLAALAHFSATLDEDLPLSWSSAAAFGADAAAGATAVVPLAGSSDDAEGSSILESTRVVEAGSQTEAPCVAVDAAASPAAAAAAAARSVGDGAHSPVLGDAHTAHTPADALIQRLALCEHAPVVTPGDALERRLARKRHMAAAVEADAALTAARSPFKAAAHVPKRRATSAAASGAESNDACGNIAPVAAMAKEQAAGLAVPAPSPPAPAAEVAIAAARHATEQAAAQRGFSLWRRMLGGLGVLGQ